MRKWILAPAMAVMLTATLGSAGPASEPPECVLAARWVQANSDALPTTLRELSAFSMAYRRAIYEALPSDVRGSLWREHMERFLLPESSLNDVQRAALRDVIARLPELTVPDQSPAGRQEFTEQLTTIFPNDLGVRIFFTLGDAPPSRTTGTGAPFCSCDAQYEAIGAFKTCPSGSTCTSLGCNTTSTGCGFAWSRSCTGFCRT